MKVFLFCIIIITSLNMTAQDSWKVYCGKKQLLKTSVSDEVKNIIRLDEKALSGKNDFIIKYTDEDPQKDWKRMIAVFDEKDNQLRIVENADTFTLPVAELKEMLEKKGKLKFYTWSLPNDPELAARIRIRRVHLYTVEMK